MKKTNNRIIRNPKKWQHFAVNFILLRFYDLWYFRTFRNCSHFSQIHLCRKRVFFTSLAKNPEGSQIMSLHLSLHSFKLSLNLNLQILINSRKNRKIRQKILRKLFWVKLCEVHCEPPNSNFHWIEFIPTPLSI